MRSVVKSFVKLSSTYAIGNLASNALNFVFIPLYTTYLSVVDYGIVALMTVTVSLVTIFISAPITSAFSRYYYAPEYKGRNGSLLFSLLIVLFVKSTLLAIAFYSLSTILAEKLLDDPNHVAIIQLYSVILFFQPFRNFFQTLIQMLEKARYFVVISLLGLGLSAVLILYLLIGLQLGIFALILGSLFTVVFVVIMGFPVFLSVAKAEFSLGVLSEPLKYSYPLLLSGYSNLLIQSGDRYILRLYGSVNIVGLYSFGYSIASVINVALVEPLKNALFPTVFKQEGTPDALRKFVSANATNFYFVALFVCLFLSVYSREMVMLIAQKQEFWSSYIIIPVIAYSYVLHGIVNFSSKGMTMAKKSWHGSFVVFVVAVVNLSLNVIFVPRWGILGAAVATLVSYFAWNALNMYYSARFYSLRFELLRLGHITLVGTALFSLSLLVDATFDFWLGITLKAGLLVCYPAMLWISGFFRVPEKDYIYHLWTRLRQEGPVALVRSFRSKGIQ